VGRPLAKFAWEQPFIISSDARPPILGCLFHADRALGEDPGDLPLAASGRRDDVLRSESEEVVAA